jgi:transcriptional regulator of heat shock response
MRLRSQINHMTPQISKEAMEKAIDIMNNHSGLRTFSLREHDLIQKYALEFTNYQKRIDELEKQLSRNSNANLGGL